MPMRRKQSLITSSLVVVVFDSLNVLIAVCKRDLEIVRQRGERLEIVHRSIVFVFVKITNYELIRRSSLYSAPPWNGMIDVRKINRRSEFSIMSHCRVGNNCSFTKLSFCLLACSNYFMSASRAAPCQARSAPQQPLDS